MGLLLTRRGAESPRPDQSERTRRCTWQLMLKPPELSKSKDISDDLGAGRVDLPFPIEAERAIRKIDDAIESGRRSVR